MLATALLSLCLLSASVSAAPYNSRRQAPAKKMTIAQLLQFAPTASSCSPAAQFADECRTAAQAVPLINAAFSNFSINTVGEQAALASLMSFETGDFQFDRNHFPAPGNPGQGTRNLMQFPNVLAYALNTTSTAAQAQSLVPDPSDVNVSDDTKNAVLALMLPDDLSFASAAWFYTTNCAQESIVSGLQAGTEAGWENFITNCISTTVTDDRKTAYLNALSALS